MEPKKSEAKILNEIRKLSVGALRLFRNNNGVAKMQDGSVVRYGMGNGTSDLIGFYRLHITSEMVGQDVAIFTAIEVKSSSGRATPEQNNFIRFVRQSGGIAGIARSPEEVKELIDTYTKIISS